MEKKRILYGIASVGAGNTSRTLAIIDKLPADRYEIRFVAQGRAYENLKHLFQTYKLEEVTYGSGDFGALNIIRKNLSFPYKLYKNIKRCGEILDEYKPDLVIVDSDFYCFIPAQKRKIPVISINSSIATVEKYKQYRQSALDCFFSFNIIEKTDSWLQKKFANINICPIITKINNLNKNVQQVSLIVRDQFKENISDEEYKYDAVVMFGGSGIGAKDLNLKDIKRKILMLGQTNNLQIPEGTECIEFDPQPIKYLSKAKVVIIQGGFNSLSEVITLRKPTICVPINGHAEQYANAKWLEELGLGLYSDSNNINKNLEKILDNYDSYLSNCKNHKISSTGAEESAEIIRNFLDG